MCFGKKGGSNAKPMTEEQKRKQRAGDDASVNAMNRNYRDQARGVTKSAPKSSARPMARSGSSARGSLLNGGK